MKKLALVFLLLSMSGCQLTPGNSLDMPYEDGWIQLTPHWPYAETQWLQHAQLTFADQQQDFLLSLYLQTDSVTLVAMSMYGQPLFRAELTAAGIDIQATEQLPDSRLPVRILAEMQLALWPLETIQSNLRGLVLDETNTANWQRTLNDYRGQRLLTIHGDTEALESDVIQLEHALYSLKITTLEREYLD